MRAAELLHRLVGIALLACWVTPGWAQLEAPRRVALVVGNNAYGTAPLLNPVNDARAMAAALQSAGFTVILKTDAKLQDLTGAVREFGNRLKDGGPGTAGLFYFAGHGMQIKGRNFLVPVGASIEHEDELAYQALDAQAVMDKMESAGNGTNIVILDACRNNPFVRSFRSARQGLAQMEAPVGSVVAFSTAPGSVASDGNGSNGLYTAHLLAAMKGPGVKVEEVFKQVRVAVLRDTGGKQVPWESTSLVGDFFFVAPQPGAQAGLVALPPAAGSALDPQVAIDDALWSAVKDSTSSAEIFAYLNRFPIGRHAREARARLTDLVAPAARPTPDSASRPLADAEVENVLRQSESGERDRQANIAAAQVRIDEIVTWGDVGTDRRPSNPKRNAHAFTEGDRYRWRVFDQISERYTRDYFWRIDRIEADGSLWVNDGQQRLDAQGQLRGGSDEQSGLWIDWLPPLPLGEALKAVPGSEMAVTSQVQFRDADGHITRATLGGRLLGAVPEQLMTLDGLRPTRRVEAYLSGPATHSNGKRFQLTLNLSWSFAPQVGLPVKTTLEERADDRLVRRTRHELTALDVFSLPGRRVLALQ